MTHAQSADSITLSREVADFLTELAVTLHKLTIYPDQHPLLVTAVDQLLGDLAFLLVEQPAVGVAVTPTQLMVGGIATDPGHALLREFAGRLHRTGIGAITFSRGVERDELLEALRSIVREPTRPGQSDETAAEQPDQWPHVHIYPLNYDHLELNAGDEHAPTWAGGLWLRLARSALDGSDIDDRALLSDPALVARAIADRANDPAFDREIGRYIAELSEAGAQRGGAEGMALQRYVNRMVGSLDTGTLERLVTLQGGAEERRRFVLRTAQVATVDTVVDLVQAAAAAEDRSISPSLLQLFHKLANHAQSGTAAGRVRAEEALRDQVQELIEGWDAYAIEQPVDADYQATLAALPGAGAQAAEEGGRAYPCEPIRMIQTSLEVGVIAPATDRAMEAQIQAGGVIELLAVLDLAGPGDAVAAELRSRVLSVDTMGIVLARRPVDFDVLMRLVSAVGEPAVDLLLDSLAMEEDRAARRRFLELLAAGGPRVARRAAARLDQEAPWYVSRNLLTLLGMLPHPPQDLNAMGFLKHADVRVRQEALKLLLRLPGARDRALCDALGSEDLMTVRLGLAAAAERCPSAAVPLLVRQVSGGRLDDGAAVLGVRALTRTRQAAAMECLLQITRSRTRLLRRPCLSAKSPVVLAALTGLAQSWPRNARAAAVLALALKHPDDEIRAAARVEPVPAPEAAR